MTAKPKGVTAKENGEQPAKDDLTRPGKFSLEALLAGRLNPVKSAWVTFDPDRAGRVDDLKRKRTQLEADKVAEAATGSKRRMAAKDETLQAIRDIDAQIETLTAELEGTWFEVQFRPMTVLEQDDVRATGVKGAALMSAVMWAKCAQLRPSGSESEEDWETLAVAEWSKVIDAIGIPQFEELDKTFGSITWGDRQVTPDFFGLPSQRRTTPTS